MTGKFYISMDFEADIFQDTFSYWKDGYSLNLTFVMGITPADEQTQKEFDDIQLESLYRNVAWLNWLTIRVANTGQRTVNPTDIFLDPRDCDIASFASRREATRFKSLLSDIFNGTKSMTTGYYGKNDLKTEIEKEFNKKRDILNKENSEEKPENNEEYFIIPDDILQRLSDYMKRVNVNKLYID